MQASRQGSQTTISAPAAGGYALTEPRSPTPPDSVVGEHFPLDTRPPCQCGRPIIRSQPYRMERRLEECCYRCATRCQKRCSSPHPSSTGLGALAGLRRPTSCLGNPVAVLAAHAELRRVGAVAALAAGAGHADEGVTGGWAR